jgi:hypothetical protein
LIGSRKVSNVSGNEIHYCESETPGGDVRRQVAGLSGLIVTSEQSKDEPMVEELFHESLAVTAVEQLFQSFNEKSSAHVYEREEEFVYRGSDKTQKEKYKDDPSGDVKNRRAKHRGTSLRKIWIWAALRVTAPMW